MSDWARRWTRVVGVVALAVATAACPSTLQFRDVQSDFETAVRLDNEAAASPPLVAAQGRAEEQYERVVAELSEEFVTALDARLQPNARMLRAVSLWRTGRHVNAITEAEKGRTALAAPGAGTKPGSRDEIMLTLIPGVVIDDETKAAVAAAGSLDAAAIRSFSKKYENAWGHLEKAREATTSATSAGMSAYLRFERWRVLQNWSAVVFPNPATSSPEVKSAAASVRDDLKARLAVEFPKSAEAERDAIPADHALRRLIASLGGG